MPVTETAQQLIKSFVTQRDAWNPIIDRDQMDPIPSRVTIAERKQLAHVLGVSPEQLVEPTVASFTQFTEPAGQKEWAWSAVPILPNYKDWYFETIRIRERWKEMLNHSIGSQIPLVFIKAQDLSVQTPIENTTFEAYFLSEVLRLGGSEDDWPPIKYTELTLQQIIRNRGSWELSHEPPIGLYPKELLEIGPLLIDTRSFTNALQATS